MMTNAQPDDIQTFKGFEHVGWQSVASQYQQYFVALTQQTMAPMLDALHVTPGTRLLDVACGPGFLAAEAARRGVNAVGLDFSASMVTIASQHYPEVLFLVGDAETLPFPEHTFDAVVLNFGLLHLEHPEQALREIYRVLRAGGRFALTLWGRQEETTGFDITLHAVQSHGNPNVSLPPAPPFFRFSEPSELERVLREAGFAQPTIKQLPLLWHLPSADSLFEVMMTASVRMRGVLERQSTEALTAIRHTIHEATQAYECDGSIELPMPALLAATAKIQK